MLDKLFFRKFVFPGSRSGSSSDQDTLGSLFYPPSRPTTPSEVKQNPVRGCCASLGHLARQLSPPSPVVNANLRFQCYCAHAFFCATTTELGLDLIESLLWPPCLNGSFRRCNRLSSFPFIRVRKQRPAARFFMSQTLMPKRDQPRFHINIPGLDG
jgi:hypothetical protein